MTPRSRLSLEAAAEGLDRHALLAMTAHWAAITAR